MKAGSELLGLATGSPTQIIDGGDVTQIEAVLRHADPETNQNTQGTDHRPGPLEGLLRGYRSPCDEVPDHGAR
jgi:hypothetical protein